MANKVTDDFKEVLILGSSVDRYALSTNYPGKTFIHKNQEIQHNAVVDGPRQVGLATLHHPGVGLYGDLHPPFWDPEVWHQWEHSHKRAKVVPESQGKKWKSVPTWSVIEKASEFSRAVLGTGSPALVVVESSLWDLSGWWWNTGQHQATHERLEQWCNKDLPYLLKSVTDVFNQSRVFFRTAPRTRMSGLKYSLEHFEAMHECVMRRSAGTGEVFEHVGVIDYHEIMDGLVARTAESELDSLWLPDGYHPAALPGRMYLNKIFGLLGRSPLEAPDDGREIFAEDEGKDSFVEDEDDF